MSDDENRPALDGAEDAQTKRAKKGLTRRQVVMRLSWGAAAVAAGVPLTRHLLRSDPPVTTMGSAADLRVDGVTLVDPRSGTRRSGMSVLVRGGRIDAVGPSSSFGEPGDVRVVDGAGQFVVPGYNNMHTHVVQEERSRLVTATMLAEGTTGMRQMAGSEELLRYRAENRLGLDSNAPGLLGMPGALLMPWNAGSVQEVRDTIAQQKEQGADFVKLIQVDRDVFFAAVEAAHEHGLKIAGHLPPTILPGEASEAGFDCLEHLGTSSNIWIETSARPTTLHAEVDPAGTVPTWLADLPFAEQLFTSGPVTRMTGKQLLNPALTLSPAAIDLMRRALDSFDEQSATELAGVLARNKTWQTPTLVRLRTQYRADAAEYENHPWQARMSQQALDDYRDVREKFLDLPSSTLSTFHDFYDMSRRMVGLLHDAGAPIMVGTDGSGATPGLDMPSEFRELAAAGLKPLDVLRAATTAPADYLGRADRMGAVEAGRDADFLLLEADPLTDVRNLSGVTAVVRAGHLHTAGELDTLVDRLTAAAP